jgi:hypothetical protein
LCAIGRHKCTCGLEGRVVFFQAGNGRRETWQHELPKLAAEFTEKTRKARGILLPQRPRGAQRKPGRAGCKAILECAGKPAALQGLAGDGGLNFLFVYVEVGVNVLHVVVIFQSFDHTDHLLCLLAAQLHVILRHPAYFRG